MQQTQIYSTGQAQQLTLHVRNGNLENIQVAISHVRNVSTENQGQISDFLRGLPSRPNEIILRDGFYRLKFSLNITAFVDQHGNLAMAKIEICGEERILSNESDLQVIYQMISIIRFCIFLNEVLEYI